MERDRGYWEHLILRAVYSLMFMVVGRLAMLLVSILAVVQFVLVAINSEPQKELQDFQLALAEYQRQIAQYLSMATEHKPFPFNDWPKQ